MPLAEVAPLKYSVDSTLISTVARCVLEGGFSTRFRKWSPCGGEDSRDCGRIVEVVGGISSTTRNA